MTPTIAEVRDALLTFNGMARSEMAARLDPLELVIVTRDEWRAMLDAMTAERRRDLSDRSQPCALDTRCYRYLGHDGEHLYGRPGDD